MDIKVTKEMKICIKAIKDNKKLIFVSGKAGVGKSVLINYLKTYFRKPENKKNIFCCAPTGIAAINISAGTIHKTFGFPATLLTSENVFRKKDQASLEILKELEVLIIDEISMVRADVMDAIDYSLRLNRRRSSEPFGGVQIVVVGDLFQLPPIIKGYQDIEYFNKYYETEFFFSSNIINYLISSTDFCYIKLNKVFRQKDKVFIDILNNIRVNENHRESLAKVNRACYGIDGKASLIERDITLCAKNKTAEAINLQHLSKIQSVFWKSKAHIKGDFNINMPTPDELYLKIGAQVMFTKNGTAWANGTIGEVTEFRNKSVMVKLKENGKIVEVKKEKWEIVKPFINQETNQIEDLVTGSFQQYPLMLAWAVTIHKSQGLTMDSVRIDLEGGAFAAGQVYVALSRCKTLEGISLSYPLSMKDVKLDKRVVDFYNSIEKYAA